jgi:hypothetical protein
VNIRREEQIINQRVCEGGVRVCTHVRDREKIATIRKTEIQMVREFERECMQQRVQQRRSFKRIGIDQ